MKNEEKINLKKSLISTTNTRDQKEAGLIETSFPFPPAYRGADKSLARPTSRCILFDGENISFDASLVIYIYIYTHTHIYSTNIPPIMIINRIYET